MLNINKNNHLYSQKKYFSMNFFIHSIVIVVTIKLKFFHRKNLSLTTSICHFYI